MSLEHAEVLLMMGLYKRNVAVLIGSTVACGLLAGIAAAGTPQGTPSAQSAPSSQPPGQTKKQEAAAANSQPTTADNSIGVKPSSTTQHSTWATAGSNKTKQSGNGKTAGQIATHNGASAAQT